MSRERTGRAHRTWHTRTHAVTRREAEPGRVVIAAALDCDFDARCSPISNRDCAPRLKILAQISLRCGCDGLAKKRGKLPENAVRYPHRCQSVAVAKRLLVRCLGVALINYCCVRAPVLKLEIARSVVDRSGDRNALFSA